MQPYLGGQLSLAREDAGCRSSEWIIYGDGAVTADGSVYFGLRRCAHLGIAVSRDERESWSVRDVPGADLIAYEGLFSHSRLLNLMVPSPLATDDDGNLYAIWADAGDTLRYAVSRDGGNTWSSPVAINAPSTAARRITRSSAASFIADACVVRCSDRR